MEWYSQFQFFFNVFSFKRTSLLHQKQHSLLLIQILPCGCLSTAYLIGSFSHYQAVNIRNKRFTYVYAQLLNQCNEYIDTIC